MRPRSFFIKYSREFAIIIAGIILILIFSILQREYFRLNNFVQIVKQASINGFLAIGMSFVIINGGIDLSVGSTLAIVVVTVGKFLVNGTNPVISILIGLVLGFLLGSVNGLLVSTMKLQPFIATLGTMSVYRGIAYLITGGWPVLNIPSNFRKMVDGNFFDFIPISVVLLLVCVSIGYIILRHTKLGYYLYAIGGNEEAARLSGVNVNLNKVMAYGLCGICAAICGMLMLARLGTGEPTAGQGYELNAIAAVAIGGTSLAGGKGSVICTLLGALLLQALRVGLVVCGVDAFWQFIATGAIIVVAAYFETAQGTLGNLFKKIFNNN